MSFNLPEADIRQRLVRLRNLETLHAQARARIERLEQENRELKARYETDTAALKDQLETVMLQLAELQKKVFGSKRKRNSDPDQTSSSETGSQSEKQPRSKSSYQRPTPNDEEVTKTAHHPVSTCKHCGGALSGFEEVVRYVEDIILPQLIEKTTKTITKHIIERGYCATCGNWTAALPLRGHLVSLGQNIKLLVCYLTTILDCSYEQVKTLTSDLYGLTLSDGEIVNILKETAQSWLPEYERLKAHMRAGPGAHIDETTWPIQAFAKHCYAWVMSAVGSPIRIYTLATSRGKDHAQELLGGVSDTFVRITDCYAAYKNMAGLHQICWAHLYRKIRDLLNNANLPAEKRPHIAAWHDEFAVIYADLRAALTLPFKPRQRQRQERELRQRLAPLCQPHARDPKPLSDLKALLVEYDHALFTCLKFQNIPCDNNRAERDLRSLVIKRKKSFGSRTEAGAHALGILLSVAWSTWYANRENFFPALAAVAEKHQKT